MKSILQGILTLIGLFFALYGLYFLIVFSGYFQKKKAFPPAAPKTRFAVLIAARNEEIVIGDLVDSLRQHAYPCELYDIFVIPNHCHDRTEEIARMHGAKIISCMVPVKSKGDVLRYAFQTLRNDPYDAYCIFDADNIADKHFLAAMNRAFCSGALVAQGYRESKNPGSSWISGGYSLYFRLMNECYNRPRAARHLPIFLGGTGFAISRECLRQIPWATSSMVEDCEYSLACILHDIKIEWVHDAVTYDEQPIRFGQSYHQRRRWSSGMLGLCRREAASLLKGQPAQKQRPQRLEAFLFLSAPAIQAASLLSPALLLILYLLDPRPEVLLYGFLLPNALSIVGTTLFAWILSKAGPKFNGAIWKGALFFWLFITTWSCIHLIGLFKRTGEWKEIRHTQHADRRLSPAEPAKRSKARRKRALSEPLI